jgi:hypothetical protein
MASVGWFRDLLMLAFSVLLLVITGLLAADSRFAVSPMEGGRSLLPLSLIIIATICMLWTLRLWTTMSFRRALLSLVISLSVTWVVALGCLEGMARRDAVFLRTSKVAGRRRIRTALRLTRVEATLAVALYIGAGILATSHHPPWLLVFIIFIQATVYLCGPIASVWNLWAAGVEAPEYLQRFEKRRLRAERRRRSWARLPRPAAVGATLTALCAGGVASAFLAPVALLHTAAIRPAESAQSLLAGSASTQVYLKLGSATSGADRAYYFITSVQLSTVSARAGLRFSTSSLALLGEVLQAAAAGGQISQVNLAFRTPGLDGRPTTEFVDTFGTAAVTSFKEHLSGAPTGTVALALPALSHVVAAPGALQRVGPFAGLSGPVLATKVSVSMGTGAPSYAVTAVQLTQTTADAPLDLRFSTPSLPLLDGIFRDQGAGVSIPVLTLSVRAGEAGHPFAAALTRTFSGLSVGSFAENLSGSLSGTATLVVPPR